MFSLLTRDLHTTSHHCTSYLDANNRISIKLQISGHFSNSRRAQIHQLPHDFAGKGVLKTAEKTLRHFLPDRMRSYYTKRKGCMHIQGRHLGQVGGQWGLWTQRIVTCKNFAQTDLAYCWPVLLLTRLEINVFSVQT